MAPIWTVRPKKWTVEPWGPTVRDSTVQNPIWGSTKTAQITRNNFTSLFFVENSYLYGIWPYIICILPGNSITLIAIKTAQLDYASSDADAELEICDGAGTCCKTSERLDDLGVNDREGGNIDIYKTREVLGTCFTVSNVSIMSIQYFFCKVVWEYKYCRQNWEKVESLQLRM